jgi:hypothetical protein
MNSTNSESEVSKRKTDAKLKLLKDLSFLLDLKVLRVDQCTAKYVLEEGEGDLIADLAHQFTIVYSSKTYDYEGKLLVEFSEGKVSRSDKKDSHILSFLLGMKVGEKAWFNLCEQPVFRLKQELKEVEEEEVEFLGESEGEDNLDF